MIDTQKDGQTEGWTDRRMDRQNDTQKDGQTEGWTDRQLDRQTTDDRHTDRLIDGGYTNRRTHRQTDGQTN